MVYRIRFCEHSAIVVFYIIITVCYMECNYFIKNFFLYSLRVGIVSVRIGAGSRFLSELRPFL